MVTDYVQTELEIEIAKKNLEEVCKKYDIPCTIQLGNYLTTIIVEERLSAFSDDTWPEVVGCNIPASEVKAYLMSQKIFNNYYVLTQNERIKNDYKY